MSTTLIAVVIALVVGHTLPALASLRRYDWYVGWLDWLGRQLGDQPFWRGPWGLVPALAVPLLVVGLLQLGLRDDLFGLPAFVFALAVLFYAWGPRDLDHDVEAVVEAPDAATRDAAAKRLFPDRDAPSLESGALIEAVFRCALWRWFGVLFWFLLLGPFGALLYRLAALSAQGEARQRLPEGAAAAARTLLAVLDWPVAQLMTLAMALVGNFDSVLSAWKDAGGASLRADTGFLAAAARASVRHEMAEEAFEDAGTDYVPATTPALAALPALAELRDAMSLAWRILLLWLAVLALFVIAGWVA
jgi:AmpE protein